MKAIIAFLGLLLSAWQALAAPVPKTFELAALTTDNSLLLFRSDAPQTTRVVKIGGADDRVIGIDVRPVDNKLYAITQASTLYTLDAHTGVAKRVTRLGSAFRGGLASGFDFNPQADRLRLVATSGQNLRVNVDVGAVGIDGALAYAPDDLHAGSRPAIVAAGYTNSFADARSTILFVLDHALDILVKQDPPNDGVLTTVGRLGVDCGPSAGFDIAAAGGVDYAFVLCATELYALNVKTGAARALGKVQVQSQIGVAGYVGLAVLGVVQ